MPDGDMNSGAAAVPTVPSEEVSVRLFPWISPAAAEAASRVHDDVAIEAGDNRANDGARSQVEVHASAACLNV